MIGIVIVAHGGLAREYLSAVEHVVGPQTGIKAVTIEENHDRGEKQAEICAAADAVDSGDGVVVVTDLFGERLLQHMLDNSIDTRFVQRSDAPSTVAFVERGPSTNRYAFYSRASADSGWSPQPLPVLPESCRFLHFGSISLLQDPAASRISEFVAANAGQRVVVSGRR